MVKAEIEQRKSPAAVQHEERGPMGFCAASRPGCHGARKTLPALCLPSRASRHAAASEQRRPLSQEASMYAPQRGNLDDQGRLTAQKRPVCEDDQLEIPAFLRRQAN